jgi:hypothetical protein
MTSDSDCSLRESIKGQGAFPQLPGFRDLRGEMFFPDVVNIELMTGGALSELG